MTIRPGRDPVEGIDTHGTGFPPARARQGRHPRLGADALGAAVLARLAGVERIGHRRAWARSGGRDRTRTGAVGAAHAAAHAGDHAPAPVERPGGADAL